MKYIKTFEENSSDILQYCRDVMLEIIDDNIHVSIFYGNPTSSFRTFDEELGIIIRIGGHFQPRTFRVSDYIEPINHLNSYLESVGYIYFPEFYESYREFRKSLLHLSTPYLELKYIKKEYYQWPWFNTMNENLKNDYVINILTDLTLDLSDSGLKVEFLDGNQFSGRFYISISDDNKIYCKNYPRDDMDWLYNKPIMLNFYKELEDFGLKRDKDYKVYGGGTGVNLVFDDKDTIVNAFLSKTNFTGG